MAQNLKEKLSELSVSAQEAVQGGLSILLPQEEEPSFSTHYPGRRRAAGLELAGKASYIAEKAHYFATPVALPLAALEAVRFLGEFDNGRQALKGTSKVLGLKSEQFSAMLGVAAEAVLLGLNVAALNPQGIAAAAMLMAGQAIEFFHERDPKTRDMEELLSKSKIRQTYETVVGGITKFSKDHPSAKFMLEMGGSVMLATVNPVAGAFMAGATAIRMVNQFVHRNEDAELEPGFALQRA